ncbi:DNA/RNA non-specific endonuclease [Streptomyces sp. JJ36]|uniref:DNA/RNA non-specific endonuclease n=1 Tax=Streptomyces sp. JJ36 TaxID=2736645 RepID=UPI001F01C16F|nr:DNA/RNA non-specific endonuclease [Streptomyces sp. JJ36]MCF6525092.1 DNA/RNA non-specific endonuclease [Streptomyces sp. JJ36]
MCASPGPIPPDPSPGSPATATAHRTGYDEHFLGPRVPLPHPVDSGIETTLLPYTHFTVVLRPSRRLALATTVAVDGARLRDSDRDSEWRLDPRAPVTAQAGNELYRQNPLDRGHLVRRLDPVWGDRAEAEQADDDTFHYTNAAPQADVFNQGLELWLGLENHLLEHAARFDRKLVVHTGPVLLDDDPVYRGVQIPLRFWKAVAFLDRGELAATAYVLDQSPDLDDAHRALTLAEAAGDPPPLGAFRTFQAPVADVAAVTGLDLGPLPAADRMPVDVTAAPGPERWTRLGSPEDIVWRREGPAG